MQPVKAVTQPEPIDGLRFSVNVQPLDMFRMSGTWNYATFSGKQYFSACGTALHQKEDMATPYSDFVTGEFSGDKGITIMGSYIPIPQYGAMLKVEGHLESTRKLNAANYMVEARKMFGPIHVGVFKKHDAFGVSYLHRPHEAISYAAEIELFVRDFI